MLEFIPKIAEKNYVEWKEPKSIEFKIENEYKKFKFTNACMKKFHKFYNISPQASKEIYKIDTNNWNEIIKIQYDKLSEGEDLADFNLNSDNIIFIQNEENEIIDVEFFKNTDLKNDFMIKYNNYKSDIYNMDKFAKVFTDTNSNLLKLIIYDVTENLHENEYTPILILEFDLQKSEYKMSYGLLLFKEFIIVPFLDNTIYSKSFIDFVEVFNTQYYLNDCKEQSKFLFEKYLKYKENDTQISVRELLKILIKCGYKLEIKDDSMLSSLSEIENEESSLTIQEFFNSFLDITNETARDIISLPELKKIFRYNKLTLFNTFLILSKEFMNYKSGKLNSEILASLIFLMDKDITDNNQAKKLKEELMNKEV